MDLIIQWTVTPRLENCQKNVKLHKIIHFTEKNILLKRKQSDRNFKMKI